MSGNLELSEKVAKALKKKYGDIGISGDEFLEDAKLNQNLPLGPSLDLGTAGGIPEGTIVIVSGAPKKGKTTSVLSFCALAQAMGKFVYYHDAEYRIKPLNMNGIAGLKLDKEHFKLIKSTKEMILTAENHLDIMEVTANTHPGSLIVMDSSSSLCSAKERASEITASARNDGPKLFANFTRKIHDVLGVNKVTLIAIQHLIANTSGFGSPFYEDGGNKIQYAMGTKLRIKSSKPWTIGSEENKKQIGLEVTWSIIESALGAPPGGEIVSYIRFGVGIDHLKEYIEIAFGAGLIEKPEKGAWYTYIPTGEKFQGEHKLYDYFNSDEAARNELVGKVRELIG
jgi:RecA/RadA recombinase